MLENSKHNKAVLISIILIILVLAWSIGKTIMPEKLENKELSEVEQNEEIVKAPMITPEELLKKVNQSQENLRIVDLRDASVFATGHIKASANLSFTQFETGKMSTLLPAKQDELILVDEGESRAKIAQLTNDVVAAGWSQAKYLDGGISAWRDRGYTTVSSGTASLDSAKIKKASATDLKVETDYGQDLVQFIDVRDATLYSQQHVAGAINSPLTGLEKDHGNISAVKKVVVYGNTKEDDAKAAVILFDLNFFNVWVLEGGLSAWKQAGGRVEP